MDKHAGFINNIAEFAKNLKTGIGQSLRKVVETDTVRKAAKGNIEASLLNTDLLRLSLPLIGVAGAYQGGQAAIGALKQRSRLNKSEELVMSDPEIASGDKGKAQGLFNTLREYAPSIAKDPVLAKPFVQGMLSYATMDHKVVQDLMLSEKIYQELKGQPLTTIQAIRKSSWLV